MALNSVLKLFVFFGLVLFSAQYARAETSGESLDKLLSDLKGNPSREPITAIKPRAMPPHIESLYKQIAKCWRPISNFVRVEMRVDSLPDGTVKAIKVVNTQGKENNEAFIESAKAAMDVFEDPKCKKLNLPRDLYEEWKTIFVTLE